MGYLINVDNGGTLTDLCVVEGGRVFRTKVLTTPYDLSQCFFDGLRHVSREIYGDEGVERLLRAADFIRYSTTHGTNALVEKKGPRLGVILGGGLGVENLRSTASATAMFEALVAERFADVDLMLTGEAYERAVIEAVNHLTSAGANRLVVSFFDGACFVEEERRVERVLLRYFPLHLLGVVPVVFSHDVTDDTDAARRTWSALFNAFLHPAMEQFLYETEHRLRAYKTRAPLLIFRNDGGSARVAKTIALKTYGSGPRGGMEGVRALANHYGLEAVLSLDVGGTTTDVGLVKDGAIRNHRRGEIQSVPISFPLSDVRSHGVGGSSILRGRGGRVLVGPESVGSAPGPACFGFGGKEATITDVFLLMGVFDRTTFFAGKLELDTARAKAAVMENAAKPLGLGFEAALIAMESAWVAEIAAATASFAPLPPRTAIAAFGGAGPLAACSVAERAGIDRVIVPKLAAVFSALGIGFSDLSHEYELHLRDFTASGIETCLAELTGRARRDMFAEGVELSECRLQASVIQRWADQERTTSLNGTGLAENLADCDEASVHLRAVKPINHPVFCEGGVDPSPAQSAGRRTVLTEEAWRELPVYRLGDQRPGAEGRGPAIVEEEYFTAKVPAGWRFEITANGDLFLTRTTV